MNYSPNNMWISENLPDVHKASSKQRYEVEARQ